MYTNINIFEVIIPQLVSMKRLQKKEKENKKQQRSIFQLTEILLVMQQIFVIY